jgi:hypothetical protein
MSDNIQELYRTLLEEPLIIIDGLRVDMDKEIRSIYDSQLDRNIYFKFRYNEKMIDNAYTTVYSTYMNYYERD